MMDHIPKRQRLLIIFAGAGLLLLILDSIVFEPYLKHWTANAAEIQRLKLQVADGKSVVARASHTRSVWADLQHATLPSNAAESEHDMISAFGSWGRDSGLELGSIRPVWKTGPNDDTSTLECRLDATGNLRGVTRFLYELGRTPLALRTTAVELISRDDTGSSLTLSVTVSGLRLLPLEGRQ